MLTLYGRLAELTGGRCGSARGSAHRRHRAGPGDPHRATPTRNGQNLEAREGLVVTVHDGKIVSLDDFFDDLAARYDDFWA